MCASRRVCKPARRKEAARRDPPSRGVHRRPTLSFCEGFECEHTCWDPKDGELCLSEGEARGNSGGGPQRCDVQIVRRLGYRGERLIEPSSSQVSSEVSLGIGRSSRASFIG